MRVLWYTQRMRFVLFFGVLMFLVLICIFVYSWYRLRKEIVMYAENAKVESRLIENAQTEFVTTKDGVKIGFWYFPVKDSRGVVVLVHGHSNPGGKTAMLRHTEYLNEAGYTTVLPDLRSYGESDGNKAYLATKEWQDLEAVYDEIKGRPENTDKKVGYFGISMGASASIVSVGKTGKGDFVIASVPTLDLDSLFRYQIAKAGFPSSLVFPFMKLASYIELGNYQEFTPVEQVKNIKVPVMFISAKNDKTLNPEDAKLLFEKAQSEKVLWEVESGHDVYKDNKEEFEGRVLDFLEKYK